MADWQRINYFKNSLDNYGFYDEDKKKKENTQDLGYFSGNNLLSSIGGLGSISQSNNNSLFGIDNKDVNDIAGLGNQGYQLYNILGNGASSMNPWVALGTGALRSGKSALSGGSFKDDVPQAFFGIDNSNDSEIMQGLKGAGTGAMTGAAIGSIVPGIGTAIGAIIGGALGLGSSFLDDI